MKTPKTPKTEETVTAIVETSDMIEAGAEALAKIKDPKTPALDIETLYKEYNAAIVTLAKSESGITQTRLDQIPHVQTTARVVRRIGNDAYFRKNTPDALKARIIAAGFTMFRRAKSTSEALICALVDDAGMTRQTASNMVALCDSPVLVQLVTTGEDGVKMALGLAYRLAQAKATEEDSRAAALDAPSPNDAPAYLTARGLCRSILAAWPPYGAARVAAKDETATEDARQAARVEMRATWRVIAGHLAALRETGFTGMLKDYDSDVAQLVSAAELDETRRANAAIEEAQTKKNDAAEKIATLTAQTETARGAHAQTVQTLTDATNKAREKEAEINRLRALIETAGDDAAKPLRESLRKAQEEMKAEESRLANLRKEAEKAALDAGNAGAQLVTAQKELTDAESRLKIAERQSKNANPAPTRPTANNIDSLVAIYAKMDTDAIKAEFNAIIAETKEKGQFEHWLALGRGLVIGLFE